MSERAARARTTALALCAGAAITLVIAALLYTRTIDLDLDDDLLLSLVGLLAMVTVMDLVMARVMYVRLSGRK